MMWLLILLGQLSMPRMYYSPQNEAVIRGVVIHTLEENRLGIRRSERWVVAVLRALKTPDTIWVRIAPKRVFPGLLRQGDTLWVEGCLENMGGLKILLAREIRWRGGRKVLRDSTGFPLWIQGGEGP